MANTVTLSSIYLEAGTENTLRVSWTCSLSHVDHYTVVWKYTPDNSNWYSGSSNDADEKNDSYSPPDNAVKVKCRVKPVSETKSDDTSYWTGSWSDWVKYSVIDNAIPSAPSVPELTFGSKEIAGDGTYKLKATLTNIDQDDGTNEINYVQFYFYKGTGNDHFSECLVHPKTGEATGYCYVSPGSKYRCRARYVNTTNHSVNGESSTKLTLIDGSTATVYNPIYGEWCDYSDYVTPQPAVVEGFAVKAKSETEVKCTWNESTGATGYEIQYATKSAYLGSGTGDTSSVTIDSQSHQGFVTGLESGSTYYFRIRATNDTGNSTWSDKVSCVVGTTPTAPTTWSSTTTVMIGKTVKLYWVHNCEDGSDQTWARIHLVVSEADDSYTYYDEKIDIEGDTSVYEFNPDGWVDGCKLTWRVRTAGILVNSDGDPKYGDWSIERVVYIYSPVTLSMSISSGSEEGIVHTFPIDVWLFSDPESQTVVTYYISIVAKNSYQTVNNVGQTVYVSAGQEIYSKLLNTSDNPCELEISVGDLTLVDDQSYTATAVVSTSAGLTAETSVDFTMELYAVDFYPMALVTVDHETLSATIAPYCVDDDGERLQEQTINLSVYRREADGTFTLIGSGLESMTDSAVTDPHPSLDYARYRIVAQNSKLGLLSYVDLSAVKIGEPSIVIQWDEEWTQFDYDDTGVKYDEIPWSGSMVKIPYNVDVSQSNSLDVSAIEYIGRQHPVSYYGTQTGESGSWSCEIPKSDKDTIYALRRLAVYMGDVYVREPSGIGYWAQVSVSMDLTHCETTVPVTFDITRVEGGM